MICPSVPSFQISQALPRAPHGFGEMTTKYEITGNTNREFQEANKHFDVVGKIEPPHSKASVGGEQASPERRNHQSRVSQTVANSASVASDGSQLASESTQSSSIRS